MPIENTSAVRAAWFSEFTAAFPQATGMFPEGAREMPGMLIDAASWTIRTSQGPDLPQEVIRRLEALAVDLRRTGFPSGEYPVVVEKLVLAADLRGEEADVLRRAGEVMARAASRADEAGVAAAHAAQVVSAERHGDVAVARLESGTPLEYAPGQALPVMAVGRQGVWRGFAPALPPSSMGQLELHVDERMDGIALAVGDYVTVGAARGPVVEFAGGGVLIVADGTGLAAAKALVFDLLEHAERPQVHLVVGAARQEDVYDVLTFAALSKAQPWLDVTWVVERGGTADWDAAGLPQVRHLYAPLEQAVSGAGVWWGRDIVVCGPADRAGALASAMRANGAPEVTVLAHDAGLEGWFAP